WLAPSAGGSWTRRARSARRNIVQRISRDHISHVFDRRLEPVLRAAGGEVFQVETEDARNGLTRTPETTRPAYLKELRARGYHGNPGPGPVSAEGAERGDTLPVTTHAMECDALGFFGYWPFVYHLQDWFREPMTGLVEIRDSQVHYEL